jgi:hypothetical protein
MNREKEETNKGDKKCKMAVLMSYRFLYFSEKLHFNKKKKSFE